METEQLRQKTRDLKNNLSKVIRGKSDIVDLLIAALAAGGNVLMEDVPGVGKTTLAKALAASIDGIFNRVQFTPDLLPADILGSSIYNPRDANFYFRRGPVFTNILLADEINRASPRTQSALLEAMSEHQVSIDGQAHALPLPFMVIATENPIEYQGTYPLPEAQQDRFMFNLWVDYPKEDEEETVVKATTVAKSETPNKVITKEELLQLQAVVRKIPVSDHVIKYAVRLVRATRPHDEKSPDFIKKYVSNGAGPRAGQFALQATLFE